MLSTWASITMQNDRVRHYILFICQDCFTAKKVCEWSFLILNELHFLTTYQIAWRKLPSPGAELLKRAPWCCACSCCRSGSCPGTPGCPVRSASSASCPSCAGGTWRPPASCGLWQREGSHSSCVCASSYFTINTTHRGNNSQRQQTHRSRKIWGLEKMHISKTQSFIPRECIIFMRKEIVLLKKTIK